MSNQQNKPAEQKKPDAKPEVKPEDKQATPQAQPKALTEQEITKGAMELMRETADELPSSSLREFRLWIDKILKDREAGEIAKARAQILAIAQSLGVPLSELVKPKGKTATLPGIPLPAKYKHPETGATWSGRGRQPTWVAEWVAKHGNDTGITVKHD